MSVIGGILFHSVGASCAALCYTPAKKVEHWSWQTFWLLQAFFCWLLLPVIGAVLSIPDLWMVLREAPSSAMLNSFLLGAAYGVGGTAFGIAIRYVGFSLTYAISVGISCVLGTLVPPMVRGDLMTVLHRNGSEWILAGIAIGVVGIALCGLAGRWKERDIQLADNSNQEFSLAIGLPLCLLAGILSAVYAFALEQGQPIANVAAKYGAGNYQVNVIYIFSNSGAFVTTLVYCMFLHFRNGTFGEYANTKKLSFRLPWNYALAFLTGILWYSQFFFYGLGHTRMGVYRFSSWAIHMIILVLLSCVTGLLMREWLYCRPRTVRVLALAIIILIASVLALAYGNYLGNNQMSEQTT